MLSVNSWGRAGLSPSLSEQGTSLFHHFKIENKIKCKRAWGRHLAITTISHQPTEVKNLTANESARQHNIKLAINRVKTICVYIHVHVCMYEWACVAVVVCGGVLLRWTMRPTRNKQNNNNLRLNMYVCTYVMWGKVAFMFIVVTSVWLPGMEVRSRINEDALNILN